MKLLKRNEIIEIWDQQNKDILNSFCCPSCRDILVYDQDTNSYLCFNSLCLIDELKIDKDNYVIKEKENKKKELLKMKYIIINNEKIIKKNQLKSPSYNDLIKINYSLSDLNLIEKDGIYYNNENNQEISLNDIVSWYEFSIVKYWNGNNWIVEEITDFDYINIISIIELERPEPCFYFEYEIKYIHNKKEITEIFFQSNVSGALSPFYVKN